MKSKDIFIGDTSILTFFLKNEFFEKKEKKTE